MGGMDMDKEMGSGMMGSGMMKPEGEMDKPEGEWEKPEGEMSGSGMMGMKDRKTWMQRTLGEVKKCHMKCMKQEEMHEFVENMCDVRDKNMEKEGEFGNDMKGNKPEGDYGYGDNKPEGEGEGEKGGYRKRRSPQM